MLWDRRRKHSMWGQLKFVRLFLVAFTFPTQHNYITTTRPQ
jgi:hypothetical protein